MFSLLILRRGGPLRDEPKGPKDHDSECFFFYCVGANTEPTPQDISGHTRSVHSIPKLDGPFEPLLLVTYMGDGERGRGQGVKWRKVSATSWPNSDPKG